MYQFLNILYVCSIFDSGLIVYHFFLSKEVFVYDIMAILFLILMRKLNSSGKHKVIDFI